jgi:hypothetical protein
LDAVGQVQVVVGNVGNGFVYVGIQVAVGVVGLFGIRAWWQQGILWL